MKHEGSCVPGFRPSVAELLRTRKAILRIDKIHPRGQGDASDSGGGGSEGTERAWEVLDVRPALNVVHIAAPELIV